MSSPTYLNSPLAVLRPTSRPSSRNSARSTAGRSSSPHVAVTAQEESVAIRTQMSTLKHTIRHQQAQLQNLENSILRGPRPLPPGIFNETLLESELDPISPPSPSNGTIYPANGAPHKTFRRRSYDTLQGLAGPDSSLPLPRRDGFRGAFGDEDGIKEGIPTTPSKRVSSPTRTLSRIPVSSVGNARALAEDDLSASTSTLAPISPSGKRLSFTPGNTTKVLADLQAGVLNARNALENTKAQLRLSQRQVSQLTRQTEDLKEARERLRLENEGLNNVVARKERLLQEVLERARKAEAEVVTLKSQLKTETSNSKKSLREMEASLTESNARSQKAEREYITLRDSIKGLKESFKADQTSLREEMRKREEKLRKEVEEVGAKYKKLVEEVKKERESGSSAEVKRLIAESERVKKEMEAKLKEEIASLRARVEKSEQESEEAARIAKHLSEELTRLRRLMRTAGAGSVSSIPIASPPRPGSTGPVPS